ncbi:MAG: type II toxin-antitoxin system HicB family antitoxin [Mangrovibacterium sp.]
MRKMMNKITAIVEKTDTGYSAYLPDIPGVATAADAFSELRDQRGDQSIFGNS